MVYLLKSGKQRSARINAQRHPEFPRTRTGPTQLRAWPCWSATISVAYNHLSRGWNEAVATGWMPLSRLHLPPNSAGKELRIINYFYRTVWFSLPSTVLHEPAHHCHHSTTFSRFWKPGPFMLWSVQAPPYIPCTCTTIDPHLAQFALESN